MTEEKKVAEINPLKQGLKRELDPRNAKDLAGCRDKSTKTRIETPIECECPDNATLLQR